VNVEVLVILVQHVLTESKMVMKLVLTVVDHVVSFVGVPILVKRWKSRLVTPVASSNGVIMPLAQVHMVFNLQNQCFPQVVFVSLSV
jgi:hypothetical protein